MENIVRREMYTAAERLALARAPSRPNAGDYISVCFDDFFETHGDRLFGDDTAIICGIATLRGIPVTVAATVKGKNLEENVNANFGMPNPEGYRKFQRALAQAVKFNRPVITIIDTPGAYPGKTAEERGQGEAIARCLFELSSAPVPIIAVVTGEAGSGGALALGLCDRLLMLENSVYSVLSPEGFASILWKDSSRVDEACQVMKLTSYDLLDFEIADCIIEEPDGGAGEDPELILDRVGEYLFEELMQLQKLSSAQLLKKRYQKYRNVR